MDVIFLIYIIVLMKKIAIDDPQVYEVVAQVLCDGGVVMHPTETCYGLAVDIFNEEALKKLYAVKKMGFDKPVSVLVDGLGMAMEYGIFGDKAFELARAHWPGALSIVVRRSVHLPEFLNVTEDFVSLRYSSMDFCSEMVRVFGRGVSTTSANVTGEPQFYEAVDLAGVDLIVDGGKIAENKPSTIVKVEDERVEVLRQGEIQLEN